MRGLPSWSIVGFVIGCEIVCDDCAAHDEDRTQPVFGDSEFLFAPHCERCGEALDVKVIEESRS